MLSDFRYDPLYRVMEEVEVFQSIEGGYRNLFQRLKEIDNLGIIPRVFEMARYPKYEHSIGTLHQIQNMIDLAGDHVIRKKYRSPLAIAASFLHTGHFPFTYSTERSLLLAANLGNREAKNKAEDYLRKRLTSGIKYWNVDSERKEKTIQDLLLMRDCNSLYRFFSADHVAKRSSDLKRKVDGLSDENIKVVVENLIDKESDGYRYLSLANKADYVQRDALYFGTVKIDVSPKHLYGGMSQYEPQFSVSEEGLIEANLNYLKSRFYKNKNVISYSRLYEKIVASIIISSNFKMEWLHKYNDSEFERLITLNRDKKDKPVSLPKRWVKRAKKLFDPTDKSFDFRHVFSLSDVPIGKDVIDSEYELIGKGHSKRGLLEYPFKKGILISVDFKTKNQQFGSAFGDGDYESHSVHLFQNNSKCIFLPLIRTVEKLTPYMSFSNVKKIKKAIAKKLSPTGSVRFEDSDAAANIQVLKSLSSAIYSIQNKDSNFVKKLFSSITKIKTYKSVYRNFENRFWALTKGNATTSFGDAKMRREENEQFIDVARGLLLSPVRLLQYKEPSMCLNRVKKEIINLIDDDDFQKVKKGDLFEAACLIDLILCKRGEYQLFLNGMVVYDPEKRKAERDENEYDIVEIRINNNNAECHLYSCTISSNYIDKDRNKLDSFARHIHDNEFNELGINTYHAIPEDRSTWNSKYENAGVKY